MWKKDEQPDEKSQARPETTRRSGQAAPRTPSGERAAIGSAITIRGDVTGDEDLLIQGRVDGSVDLKEHAVTVGPDGVVKASITGRVLTVEGSVDGNLTATDQVILRSSARVQGDITAPRVVLEDGARFRGGVDMGEVSAAGKRTGDERSTRGKWESESGKAPAETAKASTNEAKSKTEAEAEVKR